MSDLVLGGDERGCFSFDPERLDLLDLLRLIRHLTTSVAATANHSTQAALDAVKQGCTMPIAYETLYRVAASSELPYPGWFIYLPYAET